MKDYEMFSTRKRLDKTEVPAWGSAESLHDNLHDWCGGGGFGKKVYGHMSWVPVAAFDPIFWLHHK
jgi:tyrosinase